MALLTHQYAALPTDVKGWREIVEPAKDAYWLSRRNGKDETSALLNALDVAIAAQPLSKRELAMSEWKRPLATISEEEIERVALAIERTMFAPHELPLPHDLHVKYRGTAVAAINAMSAPVGQVGDRS